MKTARRHVGGDVRGPGAPVVALLAALLAPALSPGAPTASAPLDEPTSLEWQETLAQADELLSAGKTAQAVQTYQMLLVRGQRAIITFGPRRRASVSRLAGERIAALDPQAMRVYRLLYDPQGEALYRRAARDRDRAALARVAAHYFHTSAGPKALELLGSLQFDQGRYAQAARAWQRVLDRPCPPSPDCASGPSPERASGPSPQRASGPSPGRAVLLARTAIAWHRAGVPTMRDARLVELAREFPSATAELAGRRRNVLAFARAACASATPASAPTSAPASAPASAPNVDHNVHNVGRLPMSGDVLSGHDEGGKWVTVPNRNAFVGGTLAALAMLAGQDSAGPAPAGPSAPAELVTEAGAAAARRGLAWLARTQREDGSWLSGGSAGSYPTAMTSLAGLAFLAGGSTPREGPYSRQVRRAMGFVLQQARRRQDGLIGGDHQPMFGHGFAMLFLAQCRGMEGSPRQAHEVRQVLERAVGLTAGAQSRQGGWTYTPGAGDEGSVTVTQLQALRACRNAGIAVPGSTIARAVEYLWQCQNADGGISYSHATRGRSRPAISAAAIACFYAAGVYDRGAAESPEARAVERLVAYCRENAELKPEAPSGHYFYAHLYMAQAMIQRGGPEARAYYPRIRDRLIGDMQGPDGSWAGDHVGRAYGTALACIILQLPYGYLPICQPRTGPWAQE